MRTGTLIVVFLLISILCFSQENEKKSIYYLGYGLGSSKETIRKTSCISWSLESYYQKDKIVYSLSYIKSKELLILGSSPIEKYHGMYGMYGISMGSQCYSFVIKSGAGISWGVLRGNLINTTSGTGWLSLNHSYFEEKNYVTISLPVSIDVQLKINKYAGLILTGFSDFNSKSSTYGYLVKLVIGNLREKE